MILLRYVLSVEGSRNRWKLYIVTIHNVQLPSISASHHIGPLSQQDHDCLPYDGISDYRNMFENVSTSTRNDNSFVGFFIYLCNTVVYTPCKAVNISTVDRDLAIADRISRATIID
jgi:hypothetical protein